MKIHETRLPGVKVLEPKVYQDDRGFFFESFNASDFDAAVDQGFNFVQDNHSSSVEGVLRGLHYQIRHPQGKLVRVIEGAIFDVAVDIRKDSPHFGEWVGVELSSENKIQLWIPPDFAHGFLVISSCAQVVYKATDKYAPEFDRGIRWDDLDIGIDWPDLGAPPKLSRKDLSAVALSEAELPVYRS